MVPSSVPNESIFQLSGHVNTHSVGIWCSEKAHVMVKVQSDSPKLIVFCSISLQKVYGPFFFSEATVSDTSYLDTLQLQIFSQIKDDEQENFIF